MDIGIWQNVQKTSERTRDGNLFYTGCCKFCGKQYKMKLNDFKKAKICKHIKTGIKNKRISSIFCSMKSRCYNKTKKCFRFYGSKGIKICDEWMEDPKKFEEWAINNGYKDNLTIDRKDSSKDYCPENCRWVTLSENTKYKASTITINVDGIERTGRDWAKELNIGTNTINEYRRTYGYENTVEFIRRALKNGLPDIKPTESYYEKMMLD